MSQLFKTTKRYEKWVVDHIRKKFENRWGTLSLEGTESDVKSHQKVLKKDGYSTEIVSEIYTESGGEQHKIYLLYITGAVSKRTK